MNDESPSRRRFRELALVGIAALVSAYVAYLFAPVIQQREEDAKDPVKLGEPAFHVEVREAYNQADDGIHWVFPERLPVESFAPLSPPGGPAELTEAERGKDPERLLGELGGSRVGWNCDGADCVAVSRYHVTLTGNRKQPVQIRSMRAQILAEHAAPSGTLLAIPPQGGGPADVIYIDLDADRKDARTVDERNQPTTRIFTDVENRYAEQGEPLTLIVIATTARPVVVEWELVLELTQDGTRETVTVKLDSGRPLRTIGWLAVPRYDVVYVRDYARDAIVEQQP
ncbi:hypothetical protein [Micromonospora radicis]|uniref:Uncharacterized protein n=1 Tax=Micromonospora radicis TaxID=1894971 RepID=A0A418MXH6_9ACTN|nr:hypothetical protein [Micromonospora radicis]RIV39738.1 hypothetical protein D2L64_08005 [Micromonospora radicis]